MAAIIRLLATALHRDCAASRVGAVLAGLVIFIMLAIGWLSAWLDRRELGE